MLKLSILLACHLTLAMFLRPKSLLLRDLPVRHASPYHSSTVLRYNDDPDGREHGAMVSFFQDHARAVRDSHRDRLERFKKGSIKPDASLLASAIVHGRKGEAKEVIRKAAEHVNEVGPLGCDAVWNALGYMHGQSPDFALITDLVKMYGADINRRNDFFDGTTMLYWAIHRDDIRTVKFLLELGADPRAIDNETGLEPAELALSLGFKKTAQAIREHINRNPLNE